MPNAIRRQFQDVGHTIAVPVRRGGGQPVRSVLLAMEFYIRAIHEGVVRYAKQAGWSLDATMTHTRQVPQDWQGDGILAEINTREMYEKIRGISRPLVALAVSPPGMPCPAVVMDNHAAGRMAAEHLMARGFTRFAYYQTSSAPVLDARCEAFRDAVLAAGHEFCHLHWGLISRRGQKMGRMRWLSDMLSSLRTPLGVFASSDSPAIEVQNACRMAQLSVPEQVAVIGVDNDPLYVEVAPVPLTSIDNDLGAIGFQAAALLDRIMSGQRPATKPMVIAPVGVVARKSTDILAVEDMRVARALSYILDHFRGPINVADIAEHANVSLRSLQSQFKALIGRSMIQEITRLRIEQATELLRSSDDKIETVARRSGFSSGKYMGKIFMEYFGRGPRAFRSKRNESRK